MLRVESDAHRDGNPDPHLAYGARPDDLEDLVRYGSDASEVGAGEEHQELLPSPASHVVVGANHADALVLRACRAFEEICPLRFPDPKSQKRVEGPS